LAERVHDTKRSKYMKKALMILALTMSFLGVQPVTAAQLSIRIGPPPQPRVVRVIPARPGPDYQWVDGYWYATGNHWTWHNGYWTRAPYTGAQWIAPRYENGQFYPGYWNGANGRLEHNHGWDRRRDRDYYYYTERERHDRDHDRR
jgi:hypothetical protein